MNHPHGAYTADEARSYDRDRESEDLWHLENRYAAEFLERHPGRQLLDVPVGTGRFLNLYRGRTVVGADLSEAMLEEAAARAKGVEGLSVTLVKASITDMPFESGRFDLVLCWRLLHLLPPDMLEATFRELRRVCRGTVCVQCYLPASPLERQVARAWRWLRRLSLLVRGKRQLTPWSHITSYAHPRAIVEKAASAAGLELERIAEIGSYEGTRVVAMEWKSGQ